MMAWMLPLRECNWSRPASRFSFNAKPGAPVQRPRDFVEYCVEKEWSEHYPSPNKTAAKELKKSKRKPI